MRNLLFAAALLGAVAPAMAESRDCGLALIDFTHESHGASPGHGPYVGMVSFTNASDERLEVRLIYRGPGALRVEPIILAPGATGVREVSRTPTMVSRTRLQTRTHFACATAP
jgi:hypothetical protein